MRNMSFSITTEQVKNRTKTVTRRLGWVTLKVGDRFRACRKCMGLKKGEKIEVLAVCRVVSNTRERLCDISTHAECEKEGFPELSPQEFVEMFCRKMKCERLQFVNRIEFKYVD